MEFEDCLLLFSKIPLVNKTKTRLSKILEINDVYELSLAMLLDTLQNQSNNVKFLPCLPSFHFFSSLND